MSEYIEHDQVGRSVGLVQKKYFTFARPPEGMALESGAVLGPITVAYETYGKLNQDRDNAVFVMHALSGDSHAAGYYSPDDPKPGWWDIIIGPGKCLDTDKYFVICSNVIGGCKGSTGPCSMNPETGEPYGHSFPVVTIGDMVQAQKKLIDNLGIRRLLAVIGGSLGGMQVLEWVVRYPDMVAAAIPLATTGRHSALTIAFNEVARQAIMNDPNWKGGNYYEGPFPSHGLAVARMIGHITYLSDEAMKLKFDRRLQNGTCFSFKFDPDFQVESYLHHQGKKFVHRFDANSFCYITKAGDYFDLAEQHGEGSLVKALSKAEAAFLIVSFTSDWLYPTYQSRELVQAVKKNGLDVSFCEIEAQWGHDAFLLPNDRLNLLVGGFLDRIQTRLRSENHHAA